MSDNEKTNDDRLVDGSPKEGIVPLSEVVKRVDKVVSEKPEDVRRAEKACLLW
ncbi:MAG: hypothetical protein Q8P20_06015 [bacterium]|nr:hypothetical protein [bacterium]